MAERDDKASFSSRSRSFDFDALLAQLEQLEDQHVSGAAAFTPEQREKFNALYLKFHRLATLPGTPTPRTQSHGVPHALGESGGMAPTILKKE